MNRCPYGNKKTDFRKIQEAFKDVGYILLTKENEYKNSLINLDYICDRGHESKITWVNFYHHKQGCRQCAIENSRKNFSEIREEFENRGFKLLTKEKDYKNTYTKLDYICPNGHSYYITWSNFRNKSNLGQHICSVCTKKRTDLSYIRREFEYNNLKLLSNEKEYKNKQTQLYYECQNGHKSKINFRTLRNNLGRLKCPECIEMMKNKTTRKKIKVKTTSFQIIKRRFEKYGFTLLTKESDYKTIRTVLKFICPKGHKDLTSWQNIVNSNYSKKMCSKCILEERKEKRKQSIERRKNGTQRIS